MGSSVGSCVSPVGGSCAEGSCGDSVSTLILSVGLGGMGTEGGGGIDEPARVLGTGLREGLYIHVQC